MIENLKSFNRKERFYLLGTALGNADFTLGPDFKRELGRAIETDIPDDAFVAMDYHLDWIYASLFLTLYPDQPGPYHRNELEVAGHQEDVDLLVAFNQADTTHVVLLEAKMATRWSNRQLDSKARRLDVIFGSTGQRWPTVKPHMVLLSPHEPKRLNKQRWPFWMQDYRWMCLHSPTGLQRVSRSDEAGKPSRSGSYWRAIREDEQCLLSPLTIAELGRAR